MKNNSWDEEGTRLIAAPERSEAVIPSPQRSRFIASGFVVAAIVAVLISMVTDPFANDQEAIDEASGSLSIWSKKHNDGDGDMSICTDKYYSKTTLQKAYEMPYAALFRDRRGQKKFEASDVVVVNSSIYSICDSSWAISKFDEDLRPFSAGNIQIGDPERDPDDESGYEALMHDDGVFYVVRESVLHDATATYHAIIEELAITDDGLDYVINDACSSEFEFEGDSKGFEGAIAVHSMDDKYTILGLCEGNHCSEADDKKFDRGNGRVIVMQKVDGGDEAESDCKWKTVREIKLPNSAYFKDYSAITIRESDNAVIVTSQEDSKVWIGKLTGEQEDGKWNIDTLEFDDDNAKVYRFPKNDLCQTIYCNVEGIHWIDDRMMVAVSDKMKSRGKQPFQCFDKDQSVHAFVLP